MIKKSFLFPFALALGATFPSFADTERDHDFVVGARYWDTHINSNIQVVRNGIGGEFDLADDLGVDDEGQIQYLVGARMSERSFLTVSHMSAEYDGIQRLNRGVAFKGTLYPSGTNVNARFELDMTDVNWRWEFPESDMPEQWTVGTSIGLKHISYEIVFNSSPNVPGLQQERENINFFTLVPGVDARYHMNKKLSAYGRASFFAFELIGGRPDGHFYDLEAGLTYDVCRGFDVTAGYRHFFVKTSDSPDEVEIEMAGPFIETRVKF